MSVQNSQCDISYCVLYLIIPWKLVNSAFQQVFSFYDASNTFTEGLSHASVSSDTAVLCWQAYVTDCSFQSCAQCKWWHSNVCVHACAYVCACVPCMCASVCVCTCACVFIYMHVHGYPYQQALCWGRGRDMKLDCRSDCARDHSTLTCTSHD